MTEKTHGTGGGPSRLFILRPVATTLFMVAILLAGIVGYRMLPSQHYLKLIIQLFRSLLSIPEQALM